ncbi:MAG: c-type cytochrome [Gammaproteobacteria bacterium]|nr:c-type cytochrome [Gammaproteobacteria bacterium]
MSARKKNILSAVVASMVVIGSLPARASIFDDPSNLRILAEDISAAELRTTMRSFAEGTGSRCSACHVGKIEADLSSYDFALDEKEKKLKAREMIKLVRNINEQIATAFADTGQPLVEVTCATCHRGQEKPEMIEDILQRSVESDGLDAAIAQYRDLRERYHGSYTFDFSERVLMRLAEFYGVNGDYDAALGFIDLNLEFFPRSSRTYVLRAQVLAETDDIAGARRDYERALELEPESAWIKQQLAELD